MPESFLDPQKIVQSFDLRPGDHVADFGAGHGYFTLPMARAVGANGKVYAIDIQSTAIDVVRSSASREHLLNIVPLQADLDMPMGSRIKDGLMDFVAVHNVLFQAEHKDVMLGEAWRILRNGGRLAMIEWDGDDASAGALSLGPLLALRIKKEAARAYALDAGFEYDREFAAGSHHYGLLFVKK